MKVLVTGSAGHLGEALVRTLKNQNYEVLGIDLIDSEFTDKVGTITDQEFVKQCMVGVDTVFHAASLHKPHVATHLRQDFVDTNITGTLNLLEAAVSAGVSSFVYTSTTSAFGDALKPIGNAPATWITEDVRPVPKNIYGVTKVAAENLCQLFHRNNQLPCLILRTSRFFPEEDDRKEVRKGYEDSNAKANEFLYRRVDIEDVVSAHLLAMEKAPVIGFARYIISATTPFSQDDLLELRSDAAAVVKRIIPDYEAEYRRRDWKMFPTVDRVYVNERARNELSWVPQHNFRDVLDRLKANKKLLSPLAYLIGIKGYHSTAFEDSPYPVE
ncbi:MAG: NAD-dependent epimerase/dehydratase family protein [Candidatus Hodarchaeota archaeon]